MKKICFTLCFISLFSVFCFASDANEELDSVVQEARTQTQTVKKDGGNVEKNSEYYEVVKKKKRFGSTIEQKAVKNLGLIITSTPFLTFGSWFFGFSAYLFATSNPDDSYYNVCSSWGAPMSIVGGLTCITIGLSLLLVGAVHLPKTLKQSDKGELNKQFVKFDKILENLIIVSGVFTGTGLASLGSGIGLMCYANTIQNIIQYGTGVALTTIGTLFSFIFMPLLISAISIKSVNQKKYLSVSPDIAITHDDKKGIDEGYGVKVGLRITL